MTGDHQTLALLLFSAFVAVTLGITTWASRRRHDSADEFYTGGRLFSPMENGFAISGDYLSAASFLGISGLIALNGYDGMLYSVGFLVAWLVVLFLVAELVRNCGRFTLADVVAARMGERRVRTAVGASSVTVSVLYLVAQMVGAGSLVALLLGGTSDAARSWTVVGVGALMVVYVALGGMRATTWIQIVKAVLLLAGALALTALVLLRFHGDFGELLTTAAERSGHGRDFLAPGLGYGDDWTARTDFISLGLALVLGTAGLPHILVRFSTVPTARAARRSVVWSIGLIGGFYLMTIVLGFGAAAIVGSDAVRASNAAGNTAVPLLALELGGGAGSTGGTVLFAVVAAVAFATILAVVAGITLASSASVAHDLYASFARRRDGDAGGGRYGGTDADAGADGGGGAGRRRYGDVAVARVAAVAVGGVAIGLGLLAQDLNVAFLVGLAFAVAASANLPVLLYSLFWRRFTTRGAVWSVYGGLIPAVLLVALSPVVSGGPGALLPGVDFHVFPLQNPGLVSIPLGFLAGWLGTVTSPEPPDEAKHAETEVRALTGAGAA
ncbi:solute symporter family protein [Streptomyces thermolilacinus]|uniref:Cation acetate symporter n=1 Tax=Streptomyces thermolilacinus SPC6 TaxID=1306406 RepID=A0A1D3DP16_9ACTN|nr:cation acetate symporter [Streptomyces thermolilacinus]OEJ94061.1 cation acetate symporter [Streptomyces thermolilacinus SPC6]